MGSRPIVRTSHPENDRFPCNKTHFSCNEMKEENEDLGPEHFEDSFLDDVEQNLSLETQIIY